MLANERCPAQAEAMSQMVNASAAEDTVLTLTKQDLHRQAAMLACILALNNNRSPDMGLALIFCY